MEISPQWETGSPKQEIIAFGRANKLDFLNFFLSLPPEKILSQLHLWVEILTLIFGPFIHLHPRFQANSIAILEYTFSFFSRVHEGLLNTPAGIEGTAA